MTATIASHAKINWMLRVLWQRDDRFHELETIFQEISLHDTLHVEESGSFELTCDDPTIPLDGSNLVVRAWEILQRRFGTPAVSVRLEKRIPAGGGLGGGSSNAASMLLVLKRMFDLEITDADLLAIALELGSDVPFFLRGGCAYARGRGEQLTRIPSSRELPLLLLLPKERVMTLDAFRLLATRRAGAHFEPSMTPEIAATVMRDPHAYTRQLVNDLERVVFDRLPVLEDLKQALVGAGAAWAVMSGSGSTIVGSFEDEGSRDGAAAVCEGKVRVVRASTISRRIPAGSSRPGSTD